MQIQITPDHQMRTNVKPGITLVSLCPPCLSSTLLFYVFVVCKWMNEFWLFQKVQYTEESLFWNICHHQQTTTNWAICHWPSGELTYLLLPCFKPLFTQLAVYQIWEHKRQTPGGCSLRRKVPKVYIWTSVSFAAQRSTHAGTLFCRGCFTTILLRPTVT